MDLIKLGGKPGLTAGLRNQFGRYQVEAQAMGEQTVDWETWLQQNGYQLDGNGLAQPVSQQDQDKLISSARPYL